MALIHIVLTLFIVHGASVSGVKERPVCLEEDGCFKVPDGNYASCKGCQYYVTCSMYAYYERKCPSNLEWDDDFQRCEHDSTTCGENILYKIDNTKTTGTTVPYVTQT